ncbi:DUF1294 domain-containing protein [Peribacillus cavernae]|uniref:DUF1294 domain-containing protein n=1 Tax=Peribacillus cavernae TaxID=1674310 RepID=A0A433HB06_9BACI|nr:DUF1294 domain-containing protein [Peribacillus cavernae]MDQ0220106.1 uncharacterized membrane protein YsdA (DUF1294 family) [Peribacillus cavernae]RUQ25466.1 DUF1294 domain-containing protein [Peribacillus cavernae]
MSAIWFYFLIINCFAFFTMKRDKRKAEKHQYRISEKTLWLLAWIGGATGSTAGMFLFRHKTKHASFRIGFPFLMIIQLAIVIYIVV